jgi:hypothetical protein
MENGKNTTLTAARIKKNESKNDTKAPAIEGTTPSND